MSITCLHISDAHVRADAAGVYGLDPEARLRTVLGACERARVVPDVLVLGGDQSDDGASAGMRRVRDLLADLGVPLIAVRGNHDGEDAHREVFGTSACLERDGWRILGLDSALPGEIHGAVDVAGALALLDGLDERPTLLALHHPPRAPTAHPWFRLEHGEALLSELSLRPHVRAVLSGHLHNPFELAHGGLALLGGPSTLTPFEVRGSEVVVGAGGPTGARVLRLRADGSLGHVLVAA